MSDTNPFTMEEVKRRQNIGLQTPLEHWARVRATVAHRDALALFLLKLDAWDLAVKSNGGIGLADHMRAGLDEALAAPRGE